MTGVEYSWNWGDKLGDKGRTGSHTYKVAGKYTVCMTAYDPKTKCTKTVCKTIEVGKQKIEIPGKDSDEKISAYPNPADTKISVVTLSSSDAKIHVKDTQGNEVLRYDATPNADKTIDMLIDSLPKGTYYINVEQDGKVETTKFVK
jgi:PKD repeat protein